MDTEMLKTLLRKRQEKEQDPNGLDVSMMVGDQGKELEIEVEPKDGEPKPGEDFSKSPEEEMRKIMMEAQQKKDAETASLDEDTYKDIFLEDAPGKDEEPDGKGGPFEKAMKISFLKNMKGKQ
jgi:hypothetical protein